MSEQHLLFTISIYYIYDTKLFDNVESSFTFHVLQNYLPFPEEFTLVWSDTKSFIYMTDFIQEESDDLWWAMIP